MIGGNSDEAKAKPLHDYQKFAVDWQLKRLFVRQMGGVGCLLDPGLGKTRITLTLIDYLIQLGEVKRVLIVAPLRPAYTVWGPEIRKWGFDLSNVILHDQHARAMLMGCQIEIVNYEGLAKLREIENRWDLITFDESTFCKSWKAHRSKHARRIIRTIPRRVILTGTPAINSLADLHGQMFLLDEGAALGRTKTAFDTRFMMRQGFKSQQFQKWVLRPEMKGELLDAIKDKVLRMQAEDHLDMPELVVNDLWCEMPSDAHRQYRKLKRELFAQLETGDIFATTAGSAYAKCKQFANGTVYSTDQNTGQRDSHRAHDAKITMLMDLMGELSGKPLLVFYGCTQDLERLLSFHGSPFKGCPVIKGGLKVDAVQDIIGSWNRGENRALLCQWQAASHGLNLQEACNDLACFGLTDSPEVYDQAFRRVYRQGVKGPQVRIHRLLTRGTVDEVMLERLMGKFATHEEFLGALKRHAR